MSAPSANGPRRSTSSQHAVRSRSDNDRLVHFEGQWQAAERQPLIASIKQYETNRHGLTSYGANWVAVAVHLPTETFYIASRHGWNDILRGATPDELAAKIRRASRHGTLSSP